jgi:predicted PurR-regulated permease PerM
MPTPATRQRTSDALPAPVDLQTVSLATLAALGVIVLLRYAADVLVPVVLGVLISYALEPVVRPLVRARVPRPLAAAAVLLAVVGTVGVGVWGLSDDALALVERMPLAARKLQASFRRSAGDEESAWQKVQDAAREIERSAAAAAGVAPAPAGAPQPAMPEKPLDVRSYLWTGSMGILGLGAQALLLLFLAYFLMSAGDLYKRKLVRIAGPSRSRKLVTLEMLGEIGEQIQRYLIVQVATSAVVAVVSWLAFRALGLEQAALWGLLTGLFNTIPYFGPVIVTGGVALVGFLQFGTLTMATYLAAASFAITSLEGFLLTPWLVGRAARMNEVAVFVGLMFWSWTWGAAGLLLAVPMLVIIKSICDRVDELNPIGELLGD